MLILSLTTCEKDDFSLQDVSFNDSTTLISQYASNYVHRIGTQTFSKSSNCAQCNDVEKLKTDFANLLLSNTYFIQNHTIITQRSGYPDWSMIEADKVSADKLIYSVPTRFDEGGQVTGFFSMWYDSGLLTANYFYRSFYENGFGNSRKDTSVTAEKHINKIFASLDKRGRAIKQKCQGGELYCVPSASSEAKYQMFVDCDGSVTIWRDDFCEGEGDSGGSGSQSSGTTGSSGWGSGVGSGYNGIGNSGGSGGSGNNDPLSIGDDIDGFETISLNDAVHGYLGRLQLPKPLFMGDLQQYSACYSTASGGIVDHRCGSFRVYNTLNSKGIYFPEESIETFFFSDAGLRQVSVISTFLQAHLGRRTSKVSDESAILAANIYIQLYIENADFRALADGEFAEIPGFLWPFIQEVAVEVAIELIKRNVPGVSDYSNVIDAINNVRQGDILGFLGETLNIVKRKFPALAALDLTVDGIELTGKASRAWRAVVEMKHFGSEFVEKLLTVVKNQSGSILGKLTWRGGNYGMTLADVKNPQSFFNELLGLFPDVTGPYFNPTEPLEQIYKVANDAIQIKFYSVANTTGGPTISFKIKRIERKIRFL
ncbi:hypothetical protein [Lewinella sp. IMCC34183]|uniref:hypothetical protein n=1 Tax=Lewinella sp. IMCC34183 TaxID=2248762 RepID=UPI001300825F|nr:hypothetical protein [Lewinella sp. IMCC34183]